MRPLTQDDLLPLDEYAERRGEFFESLTRYLDRYRRVRVGPRVMLVFENRQTLWFRLHELLRVARLAEPAYVQRELDWYNRLLPRSQQLQAALLLDPGQSDSAGHRFWQNLKGDDLKLRLGAPGGQSGSERHSYPAALLTCRPEDRCLGAAHWVRFQFDAAGRRLLADWQYPASVHLGYADYRHDSLPLSEDVRQSLLDDLELSDRD